MKTSQRTIQHLNKLDIKCGSVEKFNSFTNQHKDLFGIIDIIAIYNDGIAGIQACGTDFKPHERKILASKEAIDWLASGGILELWGWRKLKLKKGSKAVRWKPRIRRFKLSDFK